MVIINKQFNIYTRGVHYHPHVEKYFRIHSGCNIFCGVWATLNQTVNIFLNNKCISSNQLSYLLADGIDI